MNLKLVIKQYLTSSMLKNILGIGFFRILGILTNFLLIGLIYRYFSNEELNGLWLTISSILAWITFFDFGMGNSLRNNLTKSITNKDTKLSNMYISTTYVLMILPTLIVIAFTIIVSSLIDWKDIFKMGHASISNEYFTLFICIVFILYSLNFYLSILFAILHAIFKSYLISAIQLIVNLINLLLIFILYLLNINDLITLGVIYIGTSVFVLFLATIWLFRYNKYDLKFSFQHFNKRLIKDILNVGLKFLVLQLAIIVLFNTDNFLISKYIGVEQVTPYQLINKLLSLFTIVLGILLTPVWTKVIRDTESKNLKGVKDTFIKLLLCWAILVVGVVFTGCFSPSLIKIWTGTNIFIPKILILFMVIFTTFHMWCNIFQIILNGLGKLNIQIICYGIATIANIPLSIYLVQNTNLGSSAIIIGTILSLTIPAIFLPIYTFRHIKRI